MALNSEFTTRYDQLQPSQATRTSVVSRFAKWKSPLFMVGLTVLAGLAAIGHHLFYVYLDGKQVSEVAIPQSWVIRVGTAFAYLFKASLVAAVGIAFCQRLWYSARRSALQIQSLDAMFGVLANPLKFVNADLILRTKLLFLMAVIAWILPIPAIFSPGAMTGLHLLDSLF